MFWLNLAASEHRFNRMNAVRQPKAYVPRVRDCLHRPSLRQPFLTFWQRVADIHDPYKFLVP